HRIPPRQPDDHGARFRRRRARGAGRQGQRAALESGKGGGHKRSQARRTLRPTSAGSGMDPEMTYQSILVETKGAVTLVTLNRPEALNALDSQVLGELIAAFEAYQSFDSQRCLVLTGSEKAFAAGADIKEMAGKSFAEMYETDLFAGYDRLTGTRKPWI